MATTAMKVETEAEGCCVCGGGGELLAPEEHDASVPPLSGAPPLRTMLLQLNSNKVLPEGRICSSCARRATEAYEFSAALGARAAPPLGDKLRALRRRLHELTQRIDVFIVVGGAGATAAHGTYSEEDIIMVEKDALAAAAAADDEELERARNARGDHVYQCSVCPVSFQRVAEYRAHMASHPTDALHSCWTCGAQFDRADSLREHAATHRAAHSVCNLCHTTLQSAAELRRHEQGCPSRCPACGVTLATRAALSAHVAATHGRGAVPPLACPACFALLPDPAALSAHLLKHRQARQFVCGHDGCILRFGTRSNLMSHIRKCHGGADSPPAPAAPAAAPLTPAAPAPPAPPAAGTVACDHCERTFASVAAMKRHARVHRSAALAQEMGAEMMEELEGEVEYLEVETLEDGEYALTQHAHTHAHAHNDLMAQ